MRFYERFCSFCALCIIGKCTSRHLFAYGGLVQHKAKLKGRVLASWLILPISYKKKRVSWDVVLSMVKGPQIGDSYLHYIRKILHAKRCKRTTLLE